jgi:2'-5' RNA ligase
LQPAPAKITRGQAEAQACPRESAQVRVDFGTCAVTKRGPLGVHKNEYEGVEILSNATKLIKNEAALIVPVLEAEQYVSNFRMEYDPSASVGVPAHITINYPFTPEISNHLDYIAELSSIISGFTQFPFQLIEICTFPQAVYLSPQPTSPFIDIIQAISSGFPESQPYKDEFSQIVPHLTLAQVKENEIQSIEKMALNLLNPNLPISAKASEIWLIENFKGKWKRRMVFPLKEK